MRYFTESLAGADTTRSGKYEESEEDVDDGDFGGVGGFGGIMSRVAGPPGSVITPFA